MQQLNIKIKTNNTPSHQFWCYQTTSTPWRWGRS